MYIYIIWCKQYSRVDLEKKTEFKFVLLPRHIPSTPYVLQITEKILTRYSSHYSEFHVSPRSAFYQLFIKSMKLFIHFLLTISCCCYYFHYYYSLIWAFHISVSRWFFTGVWVTASLLKSPGLFLVFWQFSTMLSFGWSPLVRRPPNPLIPLVIP